MKAIVQYQSMLSFLFNGLINKEVVKTLNIVRLIANILFQSFFRKNDKKF